MRVCEVRVGRERLSSWPSVQVGRRPANALIPSGVADDGLGRRINVVGRRHALSTGALCAIASATGNSLLRRRQRTSGPRWPNWGAEGGGAPCVLGG